MITTTRTESRVIWLAIPLVVLASAYAFWLSGQSATESCRQPQQSNQAIPKDDAEVEVSGAEGGVRMDGSSTARRAILDDKEGGGDVGLPTLADLRIPKESRRLCDKCDDYRTRLKGRFSSIQENALRRAAQFSDWTESELWRLSANSPSLLQAIEKEFQSNFPTYEAKSLDVFAKEQRAVEKKIAAGEFEIYDAMPTVADSETVINRVSQLVVNGVPKYRLVRIPFGSDKDLDAARLIRREFAANMTSIFNQTVRRYVK